MDSNFAIAFGLTFFAGISTGLGSLVVVLSRKPSLKMLAFGLGLSSGVMVYISLVELLPESMELIRAELGEGLGGWLTIGCFFGGVALSALIDALVPKAINPHEATPVDDMLEATGFSVDDPAKRKSLERVGLFSALAIALHNVPEGMATFAASMADVGLGIPIAVAVAIHNVPEGIAVAVPIYFATGSRKKAVLYSLLSGLAEPLGAALVFLILMPFMNELVLGSLLSGVAGIMVYISFDELLPTAREYDDGHTVIIGIVAGMALMAVSLLLL